MHDVSTCMAAMESPPAAQKSLVGSRPCTQPPKAAWNACMTPASEVGSSSAHLSGSPGCATAESALALAAGTSSCSRPRCSLPAEDLRTKCLDYAYRKTPAA